MPNLTIRQVALPEVELMLDWAAREGWNPGLDDARLFQRADPQGFFMAFTERQPVAAISVVRHDARHGFLGLYICHPDHRGQGHGWALWKAGMQYLDGMVVGLDGVVEQQDNYRQSGFEFAYRNIRYAGSALRRPGVSAHRALLECRPFVEQDMSALVAMDQRITGYPRRELLASWVMDSESRCTLVGCDAGSLQAFGTIRECDEGFKIGPLMASSADQALVLLDELLVRAGADTIMLDVPEPNRMAVELAEALGLEAVFETARMYKGPCPEYRLDELFGVASFELG